MFTDLTKGDIDERTAKLIVGFIALYLASFTEFLSGDVVINSISQSYHVGGWARDIFVGSLFAITAFLLSYNGKVMLERVLSLIAAFAAFGVAMFPCKCGDYDQIIPYVHGVSTFVMFFVLAIFCCMFLLRAKKKSKVYPPALARVFIYGFCAALILLSISMLGIDHFSGGAISSKIERLTFYGERVGLVAFGIAWLTASHILPLITAAGTEDRYRLFKFQKEAGSAKVE